MDFWLKTPNAAFFLHRVNTQNFSIIICYQSTHISLLWWKFLPNNEMSQMGQVFCLPPRTYVLLFEILFVLLGKVVCFLTVYYKPVDWPCSAIYMDTVKKSNQLFKKFRASVPQKNSTYRYSPCLAWEQPQWKTVFHKKTMDSFCLMR